MEGEVGIHLGLIQRCPTHGAKSSHREFEGGRGGFDKSRKQALTEPVQRQTGSPLSLTPSRSLSLDEVQPGPGPAHLGPSTPPTSRLEPEPINKNPPSPSFPLPFLLHPRWISRRRPRSSPFSYRLFSLPLRSPPLSSRTN